MTMYRGSGHVVRWLLAFALVGASACGGLLRAGPTIAPLISARYLSVRLVMGDTADAQPTGFSSVGLMFPTIRCQASAGSEPVCPNVFSDRELTEMGLGSP